MMLLISRDDQEGIKPFLFIHVYKTAGTSVAEALKPFALNLEETRAYLRAAINPMNDYWNEENPKRDSNGFNIHSHMKARDVLGVIGGEAWNRRFTFAFVRNPWDRIVSLYCYIMKRKKHRQHDQVAGFNGFSEYIRWQCQRWNVFQKTFLFDKKGRQLVDFIGRFENIEDDFKTICQRIGIPAPTLKHCNASRNRPYQRYYDEQTKELVRKTFRSDIEAFGYDFMSEHQ